MNAAAGQTTQLQNTGVKEKELRQQKEKDTAALLWKGTLHQSVFVIGGVHANFGSGHGTRIP